VEAEISKNSPALLLTSLNSEIWNRGGKEEGRPALRLLQTGSLHFRAAQMSAFLGICHTQHVSEPNGLNVFEILSEL